MKMKLTYLSIILIAISLVGCESDSGKDEQGKFKPELLENPATAQTGSESTSNLPVFEFEESSFDFGTIHSGDTVTHIFKFKNVGDQPLLISEANGSCGCTVPKYNKEPVPAGQKGEITVTFYSSGISGQAAKTITLLANTIPSTKVLTISAEVVK
jgi:hypothetical protein